MDKKKQVLGRGLGALIPAARSTAQSAAGVEIKAFSNNLGKTALIASASSSPNPVLSANCGFMLP